MIRAITLDIDGTITKQDRRLDIECVGPVRKAEKEGLPVCLATGNILCYTRTTSVLLGTSGPLIAEDGGIVYDQEKREKHVLGGVEEVEKGMEILEDEFDEIEHTSTSQMRLTGRTLEKTIDIEEIKGVFEENDLDLRVVDSGFAIHIKSPFVNKGEALKTVTSILGISLSEVAAIGDGTNDVEMLRLSGTSYVPANGSKEAKKASSNVLSKPYGRGVREAIIDILKKRN